MKEVEQQAFDVAAVVVLLELKDVWSLIVHSFINNLGFEHIFEGILARQFHSFL
jgi:hypothetical protein